MRNKQFKKLYLKYLLFFDKEFIKKIELKGGTKPQIIVEILEERDQIIKKKRDISNLIKKGFYIGNINVYNEIVNKIEQLKIMQPDKTYIEKN